MPGFVSLEKRGLGMHAQSICWVFQGPERDTHGSSKPQSQKKFQGAPVPVADASALEGLSSARGVIGRRETAAPLILLPAARSLLDVDLQSRQVVGPNVGR